MSYQLIREHLARESLSYPAYLELMAEEAAQDSTGFDDEDAQRVEITGLNLHRSRRIARNYQVSEELATLIDHIDEPQLWMAITEPWCGDSAQCLPHVAALADRNPRIDLRILLRDDNLEIMDLYLSDGTRSIPVVVAFEEDGRELFRWGSRPAEAQAVFAVAKAEGLEKPQILEQLHLWYGRNRGAAQEVEFIDLLKTL